MKEIAFKDNTVATERLPLPVVLYPGFYGAFFGFKKSISDSQIFFCSCAREAIGNYLDFRLSREIPRNMDPNRMFILDKARFPLAAIEELQKENPTKDKTILSNLTFSNKLCHECNHVVPSYRYCHEMYGGTFKQNYGWYINKQAYEWGLEPISNRFLPYACPEDILYLLEDEEFQSAKSERLTLVQSNDFSEMSELGKKIRKHLRKIWNVVENEVRSKFGQKKVGEAWTSETILYHIVQTLYPKATILRHYRPDYLEGLELDIYVKELNLGIEYQGIQHYKPVKHWGGEAALEKLKGRDNKKKEICEKMRVSLIYFRHDEELSNSYVEEKLLGGKNAA